MRNNDFRKILFPSLIVSYLALFVIISFFIFETYSKYQKIDKSIQFVNHLKVLSESIVKLNRYRFHSFQQSDRNLNFSPKKGEKKFVLTGFENKEFNIKRLENYQSICGKSDINGTQKGKVVYYLLECYSKIGSFLKPELISLKFKTLYLFLAFDTETTNLFLDLLNKDEEKLLFHKGKAVAYAYGFKTEVFPKDLKNLFEERILHLVTPLLEKKTQISIERIGTTFVLYSTEVEDFLQKAFEKYRLEASTFCRTYKLQLLEDILFAVIILITAGIFHFWAYRYGLMKYGESLQKLEKKLFKDPLTGLLNRRFFNIYMLRKLKSLYEKREHISFILLDLDDFKHINDTYGHNFGDKVLMHVAKILKDNVRKNDVVVRWGGEEFGIFVNAPLKDATQLVERIRSSLERNPLCGVKVTASFGVGEYKGEDPKEFFKKVDEALYRAKRNGKNRVEITDR